MIAVQDTSKPASKTYSPIDIGFMRACISTYSLWTDPNFEAEILIHSPNPQFVLTYLDYKANAIQLTRFQDKDHNFTDGDIYKLATWYALKTLTLNFTQILNELEQFPTELKPTPVM